MTDAALLAAIRDQPYNHTVRLVYADWLDEHGNSEQANVIRSQFTGEPPSVTLYAKPWDFVCRSAAGENVVCADWFDVFCHFHHLARFRTPRTPRMRTAFSIADQWTESLLVRVRAGRGITVIGAAEVRKGFVHPEGGYTVEIGPVSESCDTAYDVPSGFPKSSSKPM